MSKLFREFNNSCKILKLAPNQILDLSDADWEIVRSSFEVQDKLSFRYFVGPLFSVSLSRTSHCLNIIAFYRRFYKVLEWLEKNTNYSKDHIEDVYLEICQEIRLNPSTIFTSTEIKEYIDHQVKRRQLDQQRAKNIFNDLLHFAYDNPVIKEKTANNFSLETFFEDLKRDLFEQLKKNTVLQQLSAPNLEPNSALDINGLLDDLQNRISFSIASLTEQHMSEQEIRVRIKAVVDLFRRQFQDELNKLMEESTPSDQVITYLTRLHDQLHQDLVVEFRSLLHSNRKEKATQSISNYSGSMVGLFSDLLTFCGEIQSYAKEYEDPDLEVSSEQGYVNVYYNVSKFFYRLHDGLLYTLKKYGLTSLPIEIGELVDTRKHQVIGAVQSNDQEDLLPGTIAEVVKPGYLWDEKLVDRAVVKIYSRATDEQLDALFSSYNH